MFFVLAKTLGFFSAPSNVLIALGLIGDPNAVEVLTKVIADSSASLNALGGAAIALGFIGDKSAVTTLTDMLSKRDAYKDNARAFAAVALGILGDKSELPLLSKIQLLQRATSPSGLMNAVVRKPFSVISTGRMTSISSGW